MKKKIIILIIVLLLILVTLFLILLMPTIKNKKYEEYLIREIYKNTEIKNITYLNKDNNYYIVKVDESVKVLDLNYEEVYSKDNVRESNLPLVYRRNNLFYKEKIRKKKKLLYNFYSTDNEELVFSVTAGGL